MFLLDLFRSFLPLHNPIGFGASDFILLTVAAVLVLFALLWRPIVEPCVRSLAPRAGWCMLLLAVLPVALRLLLLAHHPIPTPSVSDEFSHLLVADTLLHFRLANPPHALHQFFETFFVLQEPAYGSIYAIGQGMVLVLGRLLFGHPWAGVALATAALCSLSYWMLRAWTTPGWALAGGLVCVMQFGPLCQWMNSYWCGSVPAAAGCLVFGALPRLRENGRPRDAALLALGLAINLLTRPYESVFLVLSVLLFFAPAPRKFVRAIPVMVLVITPSVVLTLAQNKHATGSWTTLPYMLSRYQYGVPTTFTFQPNPIPHRQLTPEQQLDYETQVAVHGKDTDTIGRYFERFLFRVRFNRFFWVAPLYLAFPFFILALREKRFIWVVATLLLVSLGTNFYPYFYPHYIAAVTCLFVLVSIAGLERLSRLSVRGRPVGQDAARLILFLGTAHFLFWYGVHLFENQPFTRPLEQFQTWDIINHDDPEGRIAIHNQLMKSPGKQLVFVRYWPQHAFQEWVHNAADIDGSPIVWARDLGAAENAKLVRYYPNRSAWLLEPDARPPKLTPYVPDLALQFETPP
ncbi:MAG TPA: hypothetical protein VK335_06925 [Bryobacteraceae bacterium]|nr:hypothetical protein [Bryobacteraceae bacterium]